MKFAIYFLCAWFFTYWFIICFVTDFIDDLVKFFLIVCGLLSAWCRKVGYFLLFLLLHPVFRLICESNNINVICV